MTFGSWLTAQMAAYGFDSDLALAKELNVNHSTVSRWRKDKSVPDIPQLRRVARLFRTPMPQLVVLTGYLTSEELEVEPAWPAAQSADPIVEMISRAHVSEELKTDLLHLWEEALESEQDYVRRLIRAAEQRRDSSLSNEDEREDDLTRIARMIRMLSASLNRRLEGGDRYETAEVV